MFGRLHRPEDSFFNIEGQGVSPCVAKIRKRWPTFRKSEEGSWAFRRIESTRLESAARKSELLLCNNCLLIKLFFFCFVVVVVAIRNSARINVNYRDLRESYFDHMVERHPRKPSRTRAKQNEQNEQICLANFLAIN
jgi:hypothetical protein